MTVHAHDPAARGESPRPAPAAVDAITTTSARPRWLLPGLAVAIIVGALVVAGVLSLSTVLYAGLLGGMLLMHLGGHGGHGGRATHDKGSPRGGD